MSLLFETIKLYNGKLCNLFFHNERMNRARKELFGAASKVDLEEILQIPEENKIGLYKCRVIYDKVVRKIEWIEYVQRKIDCVKVVKSNEIDYSYKYEKREIFDSLKKKVNCRASEEILIVKNGFVTDTSYTNIVLFDGIDWITPSNPLLNGTQREKLIVERIIKEKPVRIEDLVKYESFKMINAMLEFEDAPTLSIQLIL
ncbi:MAG: aminotransferase class IV [Bacteroidota bacterium]